jgi:FkbM family methyltransferase
MPISISSTTTEAAGGSETTPVEFESGFTHAARRFFLWYRNGPRVGHPVLRRALRGMMQRHQRVILRNGLKMQVDLDRVVQHTIFWHDGDMEPQLSWAVREFLPVGGTLIDCGANCGFIGLEARLLKYARVLFIEPHPELAATIRTNVQLNQWDKDCKVLEAAASDHDGTTDLFVCQDYDGSHSLLPDWASHKNGAEKVEVKTLALKNVLETEPGFAKVDFLKIDTEGHDFSVLKGLGDKLNPVSITMLYTELGREAEAARRLLAERGYCGFAYRRQFSSRELRKALRRCAQGEPVAFYLPLEELPDGGETLWCAKGSAQECVLRELAQRDAANRA